MKNKYGLPEEKLNKIKKRDKFCIYCHKKMITPYQRSYQKDSATIEHLNHLPPWNNINTIAFCCGSCNYSRSNKKIMDWFKTPYCIDKGINYNTVAQPVRDYIENYEKFLDLILENKWAFAKTMPEIPHYYLVRGHLSEKNKKLFDELKVNINKNGYIKEFQSKEYCYFDIYNYKYWIIENILNREEIK